MSIHFGIATSIKIVIIPKILNNYEYKHKAIIKYLENKFNYVINKYKNAKQDNTNITEDCPIWVCWFQGEEYMPKIVNNCYQSIKNNCGKHPVILIHHNNIDSYINLPAHILDKVKRKLITYTHYSDIIRYYLLSKHGGIWLDSTILLTKEIKLFNSPFFSLKKECENNLYVSKEQWCAFCLGGTKNNILFNFLKDFLDEYHKKQNTLIDYYLIDYIIAIAYYNFTQVKQMIDDIPYSNIDLYYIQDNLYSTYDSPKFNSILKNTSIFKLSYKNQPHPTRNSLYHHLFNEYTPITNNI